MSSDQHVEVGRWVRYLYNPVFWFYQLAEYAMLVAAVKAMLVAR